jgi:hypothetical protein
MNSTTINYNSLYGQGQTLSENSGIVDTNEDGEPDSPEIVVNGPNESQKTAALNRFSAEQASLPVSYWGFSGAMGLGIAFSFIYNGQTG